MAQEDSPKTGAGAAISDAQKRAEINLQKVQELRRLIGDPRVRVEVPTVKVTGSSRHIAPMSRLYHIG